MSRVPDRSGSCIGRCQQPLPGTWEACHKVQPGQNIQFFVEGKVGTSISVVREGLEEILSQVIGTDGRQWTYVLRCLLVESLTVAWCTFTVDSEEEGLMMMCLVSGRTHIALRHVAGQCARGATGAVKKGRKCLSPQRVKREGKGKAMVQLGLLVGNCHQLQETCRLRLVIVNRKLCLLEVRLVREWGFLLPGRRHLRHTGDCLSDYSACTVMLSWIFTHLSLTSFTNNNNKKPQQQKQHNNNNNRRLSPSVPTVLLQRRQQRRLRSWWRHEQQSIAAALATSLHHSSRGQRKARAGEEESEKKYTAKFWKTPPPQAFFQLYDEEDAERGVRPGSVFDPVPQGRVVRHVVEHRVETCPFVQILDAPVPQMGDQVLELLQKIVSSLVEPVQVLAYGRTVGGSADGTWIRICD